MRLEQESLSGGFPPLIESNESRLSERAMIMFIKASRDCPSSHTGQAAVIAQACLTSQDDPRQLLRALVKDQEKIGNIIKVANSYHKNRGKGPQITRTSACSVVHKDFTLAKKMMLLDPEQLNEISSVFYPKYFQKYQGETELAEDLLNEYVQGLIQDKKL